MISNLLEKANNPDEHFYDSIKVLPRDIPIQNQDESDY